VPIVAVIDTNVWVSAFLNPEGFPARLYQSARRREFTLITSAPLLAELREVLCRPRLMKIRGTTLEDIEQFVQDIAEVSEIIPVTGTLQLCRDPDDDIVLETALVGQATHVISRDEDITRDPELLRQLEARGIKALTVSRFLAELTPKDT